MSLDPSNVRKAVRKLRTSVCRLPADPPAEEVHALRTRCRRVEALTKALHLDRERTGKRILKAIAPLRKRAGRVRDMDVLAGIVSKLIIDGEKDCQSRLLEHLGAERTKYGKKLGNALIGGKDRAGRAIRRYEKYLDKTLRLPNGAEKPQSNWATHTAAAALELWAELTDWPALGGENLHRFRLKVKELRYILELEKVPPASSIDTLGEVKDAIGEWHDWLTLTRIARKVLNHGSECELLRRIDSTAKEKFAVALAAANKMREHYLAETGGDPSHRLKKPGKTVAISATALVA